MTTNPQKSTNPFQILGLPEQFAVSPDQIQRAYLQRLSSAHPDLAAGGIGAVGGSPDSTDSSGSLNTDPATLNTARDTLLDDEARANLMLALVEGPPPSDHTLPDGYLMEMMQLRTQIEEELAPQSEDPGEARHRWQSWASARRKETIETISELFNQLNTDDRPDQIKQAIRTQLNAWRYTQRLIEQLDPTYDPNTELKNAEDRSRNP